MADAPQPQVPHVAEALTRKVAGLACLELTDQEAKLFTDQIGEILSYVGQLQKLDVTGVEPLMHPLEKAAALREDEVQGCPPDANGKPRVLASAPEVIDDQFKVPQII